MEERKKLFIHCTHGRQKIQRMEYLQQKCENRKTEKQSS